MERLFPFVRERRNSNWATVLGTPFKQYFIILLQCIKEEPRLNQEKC